MDPDLFNQFGTTVGNASASGSGFDTVPTSDTLQQYVDSSGNSNMPTLPQSMQAGGSILSVFGDIMAGDESQQADDYNAGLALEQGQFEVQDLDTGEQDTLSTQHAMYAKAGVTMSGSPLDTALNTATQFEMDKQIATYNAASKANMDTYEGKIAKQQGEFAAISSVVQTGEQLAMMSAGG